MKDRIDKLLRKVRLSRRTFLKYAGTTMGLYLAGQWLKFPSLLLADGRPRVVSVHDSDATNWDHSSGYFWEYVDQEIVNKMMAQGVMALTGQANHVDAWKALIPYQTGESVLIKFNFNNTSSCTDGDNDIDPLAQTANAIINGLTAIGVPRDKIWITDPSRHIPERFRNGIPSPSIQNIQYYSHGSCSGPNYHSVDYVEPSSPAASVATCPAGEKILPSQIFVDADHLINVPIFKSHGSYVTLALKNHYGSVVYENYDLTSMHAFFNEGGNSAGCDLNTTNILADINNNPHIRDKTRLVIGDGLFGNAHNHYDIDKWNIFGNDDPNILFFSTDPVAISSVMTDYIMAERGSQDHQHLHAAAKLGLGVHDHWDSFATKQYSLIDYVDFDSNNPIRANIDKKIRYFKAGYVTEEEIKEMIGLYMEGP